MEGLGDDDADDDDGDDGNDDDYVILDCLGVGKLKMLIVALIVIVIVMQFWFAWEWGRSKGRRLETPVEGGELFGVTAEFRIGRLKMMMIHCMLSFIRIGGGQLS